MAYKQFVAGEEALASDVNSYLMNQTVPQFSSVAQRDSQWTAPPNGAMCVTIDTYTQWLRVSGVWIAPGKMTTITLAQFLNVSAVQIIPGSNFTLPSTARRYLLGFHAQIFKGGAAGAVTISPNVAVAGQSALVAAMNTPESRSVYFAWSVPGSYGGGNFTIQASSGTVNLEGSSIITITDVGPT